MLLIFSTSVFCVICPVIAMAFYTLLERKGLSYAQRRKGPNKVVVSGLPQPMLDALKLLSKQWNSPLYSNPLLFYLFPGLSLGLSLVLWGAYPYPFSAVSLPYSALVFLAVSGVSVYATLGAGWASNSKYAHLGALRGVAQTISYEVSLSLVLLVFLYLQHFLEVEAVSFWGVGLSCLMAPVMAPVWAVTCLAELSRAPMDFTEGESELVSGFNTEYSSVGFTFLFMGEYLNILFLSMLTGCLLMGGPANVASFWALVPLMTVAVAFWFIWVRSTFPRFRYDQLMSMMWKCFLPVILVDLCFIGLLAC